MAKEYDIGYGKPPKRTQFPKGQSGNPQGRPKGSANFKTELQEELLEPLKVTEGGQILNISKRRAILKRTVEQALKGQMRAIELICKLWIQHLEPESPPTEGEPLSRDDRAILDQALAQMAEAKSAPSQHGDSA